MDNTKNQELLTNQLSLTDLIKTCNDLSGLYVTDETANLPDDQKEYMPCTICTYSAFLLNPDTDERKRLGIYTDEGIRELNQAWSYFTLDKLYPQLFRVDIYFNKSNTLGLQSFNEFTKALKTFEEARSNNDIIDSGDIPVLSFVFAENFSGPDTTEYDYMLDMTNPMFIQIDKDCVHLIFHLNSLQITINDDIDDYKPSNSKNNDFLDDPDVTEKDIEKEYQELDELMGIKKTDNNE